MDPTALGRYLRESREAKEITLEDAVRALRIRRDILESFEQGEFAVMDSTVRVRGMLRNYAHYLGLDEERVLQYHEAALTNSRRRRRFGRQETSSDTELLAPRKITDTPPTLPTVKIQEQSSGRVANALKNIAMFLVSVAALAVIIFVITDTLQLTQSTEPVALNPTIPAGEITITATNTATITPRATVLTDTPDASSFNIDGVQVIVEITQRSWVRIITDDTEQYVGFLEPGYRSTYSGNNSVAITAANAAALDIIYNGVEQDTFGARGQQVELIFSLSGIDITQGEGGLLPTDIPTDDSTATSIFIEATQTNTPTPQADDANANAESAQVQAIPTSAGIPTPTPLFPVNADSASVEPTENVSNASVSSESDAVANTESSASTDVQASEPTLVPTASNTPTPSAILPLRETPSNPTPTKTA